MLQNFIKIFDNLTEAMSQKKTTYFSIIYTNPAGDEKVHCDFVKA